MKKIKLNTGKFSLVDDVDYEHLSQFYWCLLNGKYAVRNCKGKSLLMHRIIMGAKKGEVIDHIDGNTLNNQRKNLRLCSVRLNLINQKKSKGVSFHKQAKKWSAYIYSNRKQTHLGLFNSYKEARNARIKASLSLFGEFSPFYDHNTRKTTTA